MTVITFGEVLWDVYPDTECLGGAPLNFAAHAARHGLDVGMLSAVGEDERGAQTLAQMHAWHVNTDRVYIHPDKETGVCDVVLDEQSVPTYRLREDAAWDRIPCEGISCEADVLYFGTLALRSAYNAATLRALLARHTYQEVFVDVNLRAPFYTAETVRFALEQATLLKISDEECPTVCALLNIPQTNDRETVAKAICEAFPQVRVLILTCGGDGACAYEAATGRFYQADAVPTTVVSTVGAGDSFSAAFLAHYARSEALEDCLNHAAALAALVIAHYEAVPPYTVSP